jgi:chromate transporter
MIRRECVDEEHWVSNETFTKLLAVYQVLPGPEAHELCVYFGRVRGGKLGGFAAGLGFMLPGFVLMLGLSALYVEAHLANHLEALFYGLTAGVAGVVARAVVRFADNFVTDAALAVIAVAGFLATVLLSASFVLVLLGGGLAYELWTNGRSWVRRANSISVFPLVVLLAGTVTISLVGQTFVEGVKTGVLSFGGAYTAIPYLHDTAVNGHHWLTNGQFVDGLAIGGILPAPLVILSTFVGYLAAGVAGALAITVGTFLLAFVAPIFLHRHLVAAAENDRLRPFLLGVAAAVVGLIAAVTVQIVKTSVVDVYTGLMAAAAFAVMLRFHAKLTVLYVVLGCGAIGALLQLTVV